MGLVDEFKRWRLVQQGLSSGKKRRTSGEGGMFWFLSRSALVRGGIYAASAAMLAAVLWKCPGMEEMGSVLLLSITAVLLICAVAIFQLNHHRSANKNGSVLLVFGGIIFHLWLLRLAGGLISTEESTLSFLLMPLALAPMIHSVLLGQRMGVYSAVFTSLFGAL
ncbi:MAG: hypothetical protein ABF332_09760, partial [Akkermansiaceae bacterium]